MRIVWAETRSRRRSCRVTEAGRWASAGDVCTQVPQSQLPSWELWYLLRMGVASRMLGGVTQMPLLWTLALSLSTANLSVHIAKKWLLE